MHLSLLDMTSRTAGEATREAQSAQDAGLHGFWLAGGWRDPLTLLALAGQSATTIGLGSSVVSVFGSHPTVVAEQALTVNDAVRGRLTLGVGVSHPHMVQGRFGVPFTRPVRRLREWLTVLDALLDKGCVDIRGELVSASTELRITGVPRPEVLVGALGEQTLRVAGGLSDGAITTFVSADQLERHTLPILAGAAADAGRPPPRLVAGMPICVTGDVEGARRRAATEFDVYRTRYTAYQANFARQGVEGPGDLALVGDEAVVTRQLDRFAAVGAAEFVANAFGTQEERRRTVALLQDLSR